MDEEPLYVFKYYQQFKSHVLLGRGMNEMKKSLYGTLVAAFFLMCGSSAFADPVTLSLGHIVKPDGPVAQAAVRFAKLINERTNGEVKIDVYDSGTLGSQRDLLEGLQLGTVDITLSSPAVMSSITPKVSVFDLPYIFKDAAHAYRILDGEVGKEVFKDCENNGYMCISVWENGFRHTTNNKRAIKTPSDFNGLKIRAPESKVYIEMLKALGANPTPMPFGELFTALQNGTVDGQENPISQSYSAHFQEVQKYMTLDGHIYACNPMLISLAAKDKLSDTQFKILVDTANEVRDWQRELVAKTECDMMNNMKAAGMEITVLSDEEKSEFVKVVKPVWLMFEDVLGKDLIEKVSK